MSNVQQEFKTEYISKIFNVRHITVIDWIKKGKLPAFMTAGGHYRIMRHDLVNFMKKKERPIPDELKSLEDKYRILIVDDEQNVIEAVKLMLEDMGIDLEIETASDGLEAGIKLGIFMPHLVILDASMSENERFNLFDGNVVVKRIKENDKLKNIKILVFTGYPDRGERLLRMGAEKLIVKGSKEADVEVFQKEVCKLLEIKSRKVVPKVVS